MANLTLYIGNKNYSSWSFRPWLGMRMAGLAFEEVLIPFDFENGNPAIKAMSPSGKVPVLKDGETLITESLGILDHVARRTPGSGLWPDDELLRSKAMSMTCEMLSGFQALRNACPMNMRRPRKAIGMTEAIAADVARIETLWGDCLEETGGPFLLGGFSIADAMFAPVVNRLDVYSFEVSDMTAAYMQRMQALPAWQEWAEAGRNEPWIVEEDEA